MRTSRRPLPCTAIVPAAPTPRTMRMSMVYGVPSLTRSPLACTDEARSSAARADARISSAEADSRAMDGDGGAVARAEELGDGEVATEAAAGAPVSDELEEPDEPDDVHAVASAARARAA